MNRCDDDDDDDDDRDSKSSNRDDRDDGPTARETRKDLRDRYEAYGDIDDDDFIEGSLTDFRLGHRLNYPIEDGEVYVDLHRESGQKYYTGTVVVAYEKKVDKRKSKAAIHRFHSGYGSDAQYNVWSYFGGKEAKFHGFFENGSQVIVLTIDEFTNPFLRNDKTSDDKDDTVYAGSGSIWFRSFKGHDDRSNHRNCYEGGRYIQSNAPKKCWFVSVGPFDCRAWPTNYNLDTFRALEPDSGSCYKKLADFEGLNLTEAFNLDDEDDGRPVIAK